MYGYKIEKGQEKKREAETSLNSLARNTRTIKMYDASSHFLLLSLLNHFEML